MLELNFHPFPELRTERLLLRKLAMNDVHELFFLRSDESVMQFIDRPRAASVADVEEFIKKISATVEANEGIFWAIALNDEPGKLIGTICYWNISPENYRAETGYVLHPAHWRKGIMKEALLKVIGYGFTVMKLHSIEARTNPANIASAAVLESTGFIKEAHFKEDSFFNGVFLDTVVYSNLTPV
ncbi:MAG TPA: GNAT family protein [Chitinophagaceae bacterium]